jgi:hypothetical protein
MRFNAGSAVSSRTDRWLVPDLVPTGVELRAIFVGESPHKDEVKPKNKGERFPFRGSSGRSWWVEIFDCAALSLGATPLPALSDVPPRLELERVCRDLRIAVLNAVQYPIDPKITKHYPSCVPREFLKFDKGTRDGKGMGNGKGPFGYKTVLQVQDCVDPVGGRVSDLAWRLRRFGQMPAQVVCLGHDSKWFVNQAMRRLPQDCALARQPPETIPHPARWRFSGHQSGKDYRADAVRVLKRLISEAIAS